MIINTKKNFSFPKLQELVKSILSNTKRTTKQINQLGDIIHYTDVLFYTWKILMKILSSNNENGDLYMLNILELLKKTLVNKVISKQEQEGLIDKEILGLQTGSQNFVLNVGNLKKYVRKVWQYLIKKDLSPVIHKKLLFVLIESYLPKLEDPIFLTDYLMASMNMNGVTSILALQGVAILMQKHNIEYPNIYQKLYSFFEPNIFHTKYKSRLFYLANIFLSSTHLPEIMVASFIKRASRLSLTCATPDLPIILRFVGILLIRHPALIKMIHHPTHLQVPKDPFLENEMDPMKTRASESSLWEISLLSSHCQPSVSSSSKFINAKLPSIEFDLAEVLDTSYEKMFETECVKTKKLKPTLTFQRPQETIAKLKDDQMFKLWSLAN